MSRSEVYYLWLRTCRKKEMRGRERGWKDGRKEGRKKRKEGEKKEGRKERRKRGRKGRREGCVLKKKKRMCPCWSVARKMLKKASGSREMSQVGAGRGTM